MNDIVENEAQTSNQLNKPNLAASITREEINGQVATAKEYPRSIARLSKSLLDISTFSPLAAAECNYALPRGGKSITGPSIRMAENIVQTWGNCRVGARVVHVDRFEKYLEAEGVFHDLETNAATTARVRRKISDKYGKLFNDDMINMAGNAACSIAKRNAVLAAVPKSIWSPAYDAALKVIKGDAKTLSERRDGGMKALAGFGVTPMMVFERLGVDGIEEITLEHMAEVTGIYTALKNEEQTVEALFPMKKEADGSSKNLKGKLSDIAKSTEPPHEKKPSDETVENAPTDEELNAAFEDGQIARAQGRASSIIPDKLKKPENAQVLAEWKRGHASGIPNDDGDE